MHRLTRGFVAQIHGKLRMWTQTKIYIKSYNMYFAIVEKTLIQVIYLSSFWYLCTRP